MSFITHNQKGDQFLEVTSRKIVYYEKDDGSCPFLEWRDSLNDSLFVDALRARLARIRLGLLGHCNSVGAGIQELKFYIGPGYRVYFAEWDRTIVLLLCGGDKSSQSQDIARAKEYWNDFRRANS